MEGELTEQSPNYLFGILVDDAVINLRPATPSFNDSGAAQLSQMLRNGRLGHLQTGLYVRNVTTFLRHQTPDYTEPHRMRQSLQNLRFFLKQPWICRIGLQSLYCRSPLLRAAIFSLLIYYNIMMLCQGKFCIPGLNFSKVETSFTKKGGNHPLLKFEL